MSFSLNEAMRRTGTRARITWFQPQTGLSHNSTVRYLQAVVDSLQDGRKVRPVFRLMLPTLGHYPIPGGEHEPHISRTLVGTATACRDSKRSGRQAHVLEVFATTKKKQQPQNTFS